MFKAADWGASVLGTPVERSAYLQAAIDYVEAAGGGGLELPPYALDYGQSLLVESFDNDGASVPANSAAIILRPRVRLYGSDRSKINIDSDGTLAAIYPVSPDGSGVIGVEINGNWDGVSGAGHGIIQLNDTALNTTCRDFTVEDCIIHDFPSYGVGVENGDLENVLLRGLKIYNVGADGIDSKQRGPLQRNYGLMIRDIWLENFGLRLDGQAGVDCHGIADVSGIHIKNFGRVGASVIGVRFRTLSSPGIEGDNARGSSLSGFDIVGGAYANTFGIYSGSPDCHIAQGHVQGTDTGLILGGNSVGTPNRNRVSAVTIEDAATYGFRAAGSILDAVFDGCVAENCTTGFRNEANGTVFDDCEAPNCGTKLSTSTGAAASQVIRGSGLLSTDNGFTQNASPTKAILKAIGPGADVGMFLEVKGGGRYGVSLANIPHYASDSAAAAGGVALGELYRNANDLKVRSA